MMPAKRKWLFAGAVFAIVGLVIFFMTDSKPSPPGALPDDRDIMEEFSYLIPLSKPAEILDHIFLDDRHVFLPYRSENDTYGNAHLTWTEDQWEVSFVSTNGRPVIWNVNKDGSRSFITWNMHPDEEARTARMFLTADRSFFHSGDNSYYSPRYQMEQTISFKDRSYGFESYPKKWRRMTERYAAVFAEQDSNLPFTEKIILLDDRGHETDIQKEPESSSTYDVHLNSRLFYPIEQSEIE